MARAALCPWSPAQWMKEKVAAGAKAAIATSSTPARKVLRLAGLLPWSAAPVAESPSAKTTAIAILENSNAPTTSIHRRSQCRVDDQVQLAIAIGANTTNAIRATSLNSSTKYKANRARSAKSTASSRNPPNEAAVSRLLMSVSRFMPSAVARLPRIASEISSVTDPQELITATASGTPAVPTSARPSRPGSR